MISIGIDAGKKRCVATQRDSKEMIEQIRFRNMREHNEARAACKELQ